MKFSLYFSFKIGEQCPILQILCFHNFAQPFASALDAGTTAVSGIWWDQSRFLHISQFGYPNTRNPAYQRKPESSSSNLEWPCTSPGNSRYKSREWLHFCSPVVSFWTCVVHNTYFTRRGGRYFFTTYQTILAVHSCKNLLSLSFPCHEVCKKNCEGYWTLL